MHPFRGPFFWVRAWARQPSDRFFPMGEGEGGHDAATSDRPPLLINMGETAIVRHVTGIYGTALKATSRTQLAVDCAPLSERKNCISLLACITHDATIQGQLPKVLLGNEHVFTSQLLHEVRAEMGNVLYGGTSLLGTATPQCGSVVSN